MDKLKKMILELFTKQKVDLPEKVNAELDALLKEIGEELKGDKDKDDKVVEAAIEKLGTSLQSLFKDVGKLGSSDPDEDKTDTNADKRYDELMEEVAGLKKKIDEGERGTSAKAFDKTFAKGVKEGKVAEGQKEEMTKALKGDPDLLDYHLKSVAKDRYVEGKLKDGDKVEDTIKSRAEKRDSLLDGFPAHIQKSVN